MAGTPMIFKKITAISDHSSKKCKTIYGEKAQLTLSLDVVYHLVEDDVFYEYMHR